MANVLNTDKQIAIIGQLAEGSSIRSIERQQRPRRYPYPSGCVARWRPTSMPESAKLGHYPLWSEAYLKVSMPERQQVKTPISEERYFVLAWIALGIIGYLFGAAFCLGWLGRN